MAYLYEACDTTYRRFSSIMQTMHIVRINWSKANYIQHIYYIFVAKNKQVTYR